MPTVGADAFFSEGEMNFGKAGGEEVDEVLLLEEAKVGNNMVGEKEGLSLSGLRGS